MTYDTKKLETFPTLPGVYLMKGSGGTIIYVGKANNLRQRVKQYFSPGGDGRFMVPFLISHVQEIETIVVTSEKEALLLENNLIKQHQPKYNALLKDDKTYIALKVTNKQKWPMIQLIRYRGKPKPDGLYFGPYTSAHSARATFDLLGKLFPLRQCSDQEFARRTRPCILYDMKRCIAPCVNKCSKEEYDHHVDHVVKFLRGQDREVVQDLYGELQEASDRLEFEKAQDLLKTIRQIEKTVEVQKVDKPLGTDMDAWGVFRQGDEVILVQLIYRSGKLTGSRQHNFTRIAQDDDELFESFLIQSYEKLNDLPQEILLPVSLPQKDVIAEILSTNKPRKVQIITPQKGEKKALVAMAGMNAEAVFRKEKDQRAIRERTLLEMQEKFHLRQYPKRIECFDNSNIAGSDPISALVVFTEGSKDTKRYRKYKIRSVDTQDDYASLREVLLRRYKNAKEENDLPDLVIIDGGKGHLNVALKVFAELDMITVQVIGLAKENARHDKGMTADQIYLPNIKDPIYLPRTSPVLFLLQQIRDEAHRFVISFQRNLRVKKVIKSALDDIPGIGPVKRKALLQHFGSVKKLREATEDEWAKAPKMTKKDIQALREYFQKG